MQIANCTTVEDFKRSLAECEGRIDDDLFQNIVAAGLKFGLDPYIFGGGSAGSDFGFDTTAKRYARGESAPSRLLYSRCVDDIRRAFGVTQGVSHDA